MSDTSNEFLKFFLDAKKELKLINDKLHQLYANWSKEKELFLSCCADLEGLLQDYVFS